MNTSKLTPEEMAVYRLYHKQRSQCMKKYTELRKRFLEIQIEMNKLSLTMMEYTNKMNLVKDAKLPTDKHEDKASDELLEKNELDNKYGKV
jgi:hypothetical protein